MPTCRSCRRAGGGCRRARCPSIRSRVIEAKGQMSTQQGFGRVLDEIARAGGPLADRIVTTSPDVTVSTNLGPWVNRRGLFSMVEPGGPVQGARADVAAALGDEPQGPAFRARHRRDEPVPDAGLARAVALAVRRAAAAGGHALRSLRVPRPRCAELRLLPGCALHRRRHAVGHHAGAGGRRAPVDRHAADRHGAGWARHVRAGLCGRAGRHHGVGVRLHAARRRRRTARSAGTATRRAARSTCASRRGRSISSRAHDAELCARPSSTAATGCAGPSPARSSPSSTPARWRPRRSRRPG